MMQVVRTQRPARYTLWRGPVLSRPSVPVKAPNLRLDYRGDRIKQDLHLLCNLAEFLAFSFLTSYLQVHLCLAWIRHHGGV